MQVCAALAAAEAAAHRSQEQEVKLRQALHERDKHITELSGQFNILQRKYAYLKEQHNELMWDYLPRNVQEFRSLQMNAWEGCSLVQSESNTNVDSIELHRVLGTGRFGEVFLGVIARPDGSEEELALKTVSKAQIRSLVSFRNLANEITCMRHLTASKLKAAGVPESPEAVGLTHIVTLHSARMSDAAVYLAQSLGGCDLFTLMSLYCPGGKEDLGRLPVCMVEAIGRGLLAAISAIHRNGWCHRDIKPENVLIGAHAQTLASLPCAKDAAAQIHVHVCDFGVCAPLPRDKAEPLTQFCGSPGFFAPELADAMRGGKRAAAPLDPVDAGEESDEGNISGSDALRSRPGAYEGPAADVFSAGATLLEMLLGRARFSRVWAPAYHDYVTCGRRSLTRSLRYATEEVAAALRADADAEERSGAVVAAAETTSSDGGLALRRLTALALACVDVDPGRRPTSDETVAQLAQSAPASPTKPPYSSGIKPRSRRFHRRNEMMGALDLEGDESTGEKVSALLLKQSATAPQSSRPLLLPPSDSAPRRTLRLPAAAPAAAASDRPLQAIDHDDCDGSSDSLHGAADQRPAAADSRPAAAMALTGGGGGDSDNRNGSFPVCGGSHSGVGSTGSLMSVTKTRTIRATSRVGSSLDMFLSMQHAVAKTPKENAAGAPPCG